MSLINMKGLPEKLTFITNVMDTNGHAFNGASRPQHEITFCLKIV